MAPIKPHKLDLDASYPCPCRRQGELMPIALTEAFGCRRCQQIFVVRPDGYSIEQLATTYPYKRAWYWTGLQWSQLQRGFSDGYWYFAIGLSFFLLMPILLWLPLLLQLSLKPEGLLWIIASLLIALTPAFLVWIALSRR
ncbi:hypothetical protein NBE99_05595 [Thermosynechococcus sp. HN-54]|uniref:hypothetical protein n=1 Tax=Thermosynechococcus sp. HN-54 TaxID=2933959 RepID=UPI00202CC376|nr:hypothetical protein [Thermosynechococcus sp. HN-54]URR36608.1 hypothetical protein NBE99_05595 [Thermosynechococcus sp. HN-54]